MADFFHTLNYSSINEDWRTERLALKINLDSRVLCVTGSGDRPINLLYDSPARIIAIDAVARQTEALQHKMALMQKSDYQTWLKALQDVLYQGRWEKYHRKLACFAHLLRHDEIEKLFSFTAATMEEQRKFVLQKWDNWWWRGTYLILCSRIFSRLFLRDPAFYQNVDPNLVIGAYVYQSMKRVLLTYPARQNFMISLLLRGILSDEDFPPYMLEQYYFLIKERLNAIEPVTDDLLKYLQKVEASSFDRFSLSDVPSYLDDLAFEKMLRGILHAGKHGARFCIRFFFEQSKNPPGSGA